jgi:hypothetical protein
MLDLETVKQDILEWSRGFVEVPHAALGEWAPCPFARKARLAGTVGIFVGHDPYFDLKNRSREGTGKFEVVIHAYDPAEWSYDRFHTLLDAANTDFLLCRKLVVLEDHPADIEMVNGVCMNQGKYALSMLQSLTKLNSAADHMQSKGFYHTWPSEYLTALFANRKDPR